MSFEYLGRRIEPNPNYKERGGGVLDDFGTGRHGRKISEMGPKFEEQTTFTIPKECVSDDPVVTENNEKLVKYYNEIAQHRYERFKLKTANAGKKNAGKKKISKSWEKLQNLLKTAKLYQQDVRTAGGKAVPIPKHFYDEV